ncbi:MAG: RNase adapter RapZ [Actinobacteria bacterium]|nr:RNase adapter RapZ [Actinomycetota bacterium]
MDGAAELVVITGMSGAGRTEAAKVLEDLGFYVIDNLPPTLIGQVVGLAATPRSSVDRLAVVADVRGREFFGELQEEIRALRDAHRDVRVLFLEADDDTLVRRFEASRRRHPLGESGGAEGVVEGIQRERAVLEDLRGEADLVVDTSDLNVHELRDRLVESFGSPGEATMRVNLVSFGYKHGLPRDADLVMDVRFLPNPHWEEDLRPYTGRDEPVRRYVLDQPHTAPFLDRFRDLLDTVVPGYVAEGKRYLTIAIGCTGGRHRSVAIVDEVARYLGDTTELPVHVDHRDVEHE